MMCRELMGRGSTLPQCTSKGKLVNRDNDAMYLVCLLRGDADATFSKKYFNKLMCECARSVFNQRIRFVRFQIKQSQSVFLC